MKRDSFGANENNSSWAFARVGSPESGVAVDLVSGAARRLTRPGGNSFLMERFLNSLMQHWPGVLFRQRPDLSFEFASALLEDWTGEPLAKWHEKPGLFWNVIHEGDTEEFKQQLQLAGQRPEGIASHFRLRQANTGRVIYVSEFRYARRDATGAIVGYEGYWTDVTRQTVAERRLAAAAWKETLGLVTLGLVHDFNNLLAGVLGLSESFLSQIQPDHPFHEGLTLVKRNTRQAVQLIEQISQLHRGKPGTRGYRDLNELVKDGLELLRKILPKSVDLAAEITPTPLPLYVDAVEFQQVLINLALNAADAMQERGRLTLRTGHHETLSPLKHHVGAPPRLPAACLEVTDNGHGIKEASLPFIFDPFFTTKPMNRGSGLGLYNARLFAEKHSGAISVESQEGVGTTLRVWLPLADFTEAQLAMESSSRRRRRLLLVGQPGRLLESTAEFLRRHNYHVVVRGGGDPEDLLRVGEDQLDAVMVLAEPHTAQPVALARFVRQQKLPLKMIVRSVGCNPDELDPQLYAKADLVISVDMPEDAILDKLAAVFDLPGTPG